MDYFFTRCIEAKDAQCLEKLTEYYAKKIKADDGTLPNLPGRKIFHAISEQNPAQWYDAEGIYRWLRYNIVQIADARKEAINGNLPELVQRALSIIYRDYPDENLDLNKIAVQLSVSSSRLNVIFREAMGETIWQTIIRIRMSQARELLHTSDKKVSEIANCCGYGNIPYFSKVFKEYYGITPKKCRRELHEN